MIPRDWRIPVHIPQDLTSGRGHHNCLMGGVRKKVHVWDGRRFVFSKALTKDIRSGRLKWFPVAVEG